MISGAAPATVPRLAVCSPETFRRRFVDPGSPVVVEGVAAAWPASTRWSLSALRERFPDARVQVMRAPEGRVHIGRGGTTYDASTLARYVDSLESRMTSPGYLVTKSDELPAAMRADAPWPELCGFARWRRSAIWFGPEGIVSPMHFDVPDNLYVVVKGRKRFTLVPPRDSCLVRPYGLLSGQAQYARVDPECPEAEPRFARARRCVAELGDGDALYIPRLWWHHARGLALSLAVNFWWASGARALLARASDQWKRLRGLSR